MRVRDLRRAPSCFRRQAAKASALHADNRRFDPGLEYHPRAFSSAVERSLDMADAGGSILSRRTNSRSRSSVAERSVDNRLTQVRFLTGLPTRRTKMPAAACLRRAAGLEPVKMKRQWVHHIRGDGRIAVCINRILKPVRLVAATIMHARRIRSVKPDWRWSGLLTRA
jgi:hypothetical protein